MMNFLLIWASQSLREYKSSESIINVFVSGDRQGHENFHPRMKSRVQARDSVIDSQREPTGCAVCSRGKVCAHGLVVSPVNAIAAARHY